MEDERRKRAVGPMAFRHGRFAPTLATAVSVLLLSSACQSDLTPSILEKYYFKEDDSWKNSTSVYDFVVTTNDGIKKSLKDYKGYVLMFVHIYSDFDKYDDRIQELNKINEIYYPKGVRILAFPSRCSNMFDMITGELTVPFPFLSYIIGSSLQKYPRLYFIPELVLLNHKVTFDIFEMDIVDGDIQHPLWKYLNYKFEDDFYEHKVVFSKILTNRRGEPVEQISANTPLEEYPIYINYLLA